MDYILDHLLGSHERISDLNMTVGKPLQVESDGVLVPSDLDPPLGNLTPFQTEMFAMALLNRDRRLTDTLLKEGSCDLSWEIPGKARLRVNIFSQKDNLSIAFRKLAAEVPTIGELGLPAAFHEMSREKNGLILVTGATGSGKSTSLAALLEKINEEQSVHIITLEDPIEYQHTHKKATFNQRELGADFDSFGSGLRAALRQAPKVILLGEMRDRESVEIGLSAAETGHLVLSTLHTVDAGQTIHRILGMFSTEEENQIRVRLADTVRWVVCQRLLPRVGGGRVAAFEIMRSNIRVKDTILHGEAEGKTFRDIIEAGRAFNMISFDEYIVGMYRDGLIQEETALAYGTTKGVVSRGIDTIKSTRGEKTTGIEGLELDRGYGRDKKRI
jgi:twitching motility protein PilT